MNSQTLARCLVAIGYAKSPGEEGGTYTLHVNDDALIEKTWEGSHATSETPIVSGVRSDTPACYVFPEGQSARLVFFISQSGLIDCYAYNEDESPDWVDTGFSQSSDLRPGPSSKLSAISTAEGGLVISYQDGEGKLIVKKNLPTIRGWESMSLPTVEAQDGTPLHFLVVKQKLHLFYVGRDRHLHFLVHDVQSGTWGDSVIANASFEDPIKNFDVTLDPETGEFKLCFLVQRSLWVIDKTSSGKTHVGEVDADGKLNASNKAQAGMDWDPVPYGRPCPLTWPPQQCPPPPPTWPPRWPWW